MALFPQVQKWRNVANFSTSRLQDYVSLIAIELELAKRNAVRDVILYAVLGMSAMFSLAFICVAIILSAAHTAYSVEVGWLVAAFWVLAAGGAFLLTRLGRDVTTFSALSEELSEDLKAVRESVR